MSYVCGPALLGMLTLGCATSAPDTQSVGARAGEQTVPPLNGYSPESFAHGTLFWHPALLHDGALMNEVRAAVISDAEHAALGQEGNLPELRIVISINASDRSDEAPPHLSVIGFHRSSRWLLDHGLDAEREGTIEIHDARRFLERRSSHPDVLIRLLQSPSVLRQPSDDAPVAPPLDRYEIERVGTHVLLWSPAFAEGDNALRSQVRGALLEDLDIMHRVIPEHGAQRIAASRLVVNKTTLDRSGRPKRNLGTHVSAEWLSSNELDVKRKGVIEIYDALAYLELRDTQPMALLHEHTHLMMLEADIEIEEFVQSAFTAARVSGRYGSVPYIVTPQKPREAYALVSAQEYVAELSEAYFGRNDYYPFNRRELLQFDALGAAAVRALWEGTATSTPEP